MKRYDILVCGDLWALDLVVGEFFARKGLRVCVVRRIRFGRPAEEVEVPEGFMKALLPQHIVHISRVSELVRIARNARLVLTFTGSYGFALKWRWPLRRLLGLPPVINSPTGSDFSELLMARSVTGAFYRYFVKTCDLNVGFVYPRILQNMAKLRLKNVVFLRHPFLLPELDAPRSPFQPGARLRFFHASHFDFKINDFRDQRNSSKGNDRFLRAFMRALDQGLDAECHLVDRGPDRVVARNMTATSRHAERFVWMQPLTRDELFLEMARADVVVDQFDVGGLGGIAIEAMAIGKPVLIFLHPSSLNIVYAEPPPVINAHTEDEIFEQICSHTRPELQRIGQEARRWVGQNHSWQTCLDQYLFYYSVLTGHNVVDYAGGTTANSTLEKYGGSAD
jgi:glycosyltransferase involved in cell wall biosynthesis